VKSLYHDFFKNQALIEFFFSNAKKIFVIESDFTQNPLNRSAAAHYFSASSALSRRGSPPNPSYCSF
jgi:hypothetical protein